MTGARTTTLRAVDIANAALMEVGLAPTARERYDPARRRMIVGVSSGGGNPLVRRAAYLASLAENGPSHLVRCEACFLNGIARGTVPCVTVRDALRGITCTSEAKP